MPQKITAGNWKMNLNFTEAQSLFEELSELNDLPEDVNLVIFPPSIYLAHFSAASHWISVGAQDVSAHQGGAYTGELSAEMLSSINVDFCLVGHSERREYHAETNQQLAQKVDRLLENNISPVYCCGETKDEREGGNHFAVVEKQLSEGLFHLSGEQLSKVVVAYEPVWAIGTGLTATAKEAQEMHAHIRLVLGKHFGAAMAAEITILYGGSVKPGNAKELFACQDVDGGLVGGASLKADAFIDIASAY